MESKPKDESENSPTKSEKKSLSDRDNEGSLDSSSLSWVKYALLTALSIGFVNFLLGDLSARLGVAGSFPIFYGIALMGIIYHICVKDSLAIYYKLDTT